MKNRTPQSPQSPQSPHLPQPLVHLFDQKLKYHSSVPFHEWNALEIDEEPLKAGWAFVPATREADAHWRYFRVDPKRGWTEDILDDTLHAPDELKAQVLLLPQQG